MTASLPTTDNRILTVDALRGVALFGILYSHMVMWYTGGPLPQTLYDKLDIGSGIAMGLYAAFFMAKFFSFFSFLFGLSFYLQMKSLERKRDNFVVRFGWRLLILGIIGLLHHILWPGDILSIYAPLGFILLCLRKLSNRWLLIIGFLLISNLPTKVYEAMTIEMNPTVRYNSFPKDDADRYYEVIKNEPFVEMLKSNWQAFSYKLDYQIKSGRLIATLGFFLLGMYVGRQRWFENPDTIKPLLRKICRICGIGFAVLVLVGFGTFVLDQAMNLQFQKSLWSGWFYGMLADFFNSGLTIFYIAGLTVLMYKTRWQKLLYPLVSVGKMGLTSYLMQTFFGLLLFYSFGLRLFAVTTPAINALLAVGIFAIQAAFSRWWLSNFNYGPVEWLWRSLTFLKFQPMMRRPVMQVTNAE